MTTEYRVPKRTQGTVATIAFLGTLWLMWRLPGVLPPIMAIGSAFFLSPLDALVHKPLQTILLLCPPLGVAFLAVLACHFFPIKNILRFLHLYIHPALDRDVVQPIPEPRPYDPLWGSGYGAVPDREPVLPWIKPKKGSSRAVICGALRAFALSGISKGKHGPWKKPDDLTYPFLWAVLAGRAGSGKTRMAIEFLRNELGRHDYLAKLKSRSRVRHAVMRAGHWWRHVIPWRARKYDDPWDVGWIKPYVDPNELDEHRARKRVDTCLEKLAQWLPRRPTALLLDDPKSEDSYQVVRTLMGRMGEFHYPVRVLIVCQSVPADLQFQPDKDDSDLACFHKPVLEMNEATALTADEIREMLLPSLFAMRPKWLDDRTECKTRAEAISKLTKGNPMLVELALRWLVTGRPMDSLTTDMLIEDRAERVEEALRGLSREDQWLVASATLAGNVYSVAAQQELLNRITKMRPLLRRCYNVSSRLGTGEGLPAIRPERVGDAFVRRVLNTQCEHPSQVNQVVQDAWRLNAEGVLDAVARDAAGDDKLAEALRASPPADVNVNASMLALQLSTAAAHYEWDRPYPTQGSMLALSAACTYIRSLPAAEAAKGPDLMLGLFKIDKAITNLWSGAAANCYLQSIGRMIEVGTFPRETAKIMDRIDEADGVVGAWRNDLPNIFYPSFFREAKYAGDGLEFLARYTDKNAPHAPLDQRFEERRAKVWALVGWVNSRYGSLEICQEAASAVKKIAAKFREYPEFELQCARAQESLCSAQIRSARTDEAREQISETARHVDQIAKRFSTDPRFSLESAWAWDHVAGVRSLSGTPEACQEAVTIVGRIADGFKSTAGFREEFHLVCANAKAKLCQAWVKSGRIGDCIEAARSVDSLVQDYAAQARFGFLQVYTRKLVCCGYDFFGQVEDLNKARETAKSADDIASRFRVDVIIQLELAQAWKFFCDFLARIGQVGECADVADRVQKIGLRVGADPYFALESAQAWTNACLANTNHGTLEGCREANEKVQAIADEFPAEPEIRRARAGAQRMFCESLGKVGQIKECIDAASVVDRIAHYDPASWGLGLECAMAWRAVCLANANYGTFIACRQAANEVRTLAARFPGHAEFSKELEQCQQFVNFAEQKHSKPQAPYTGGAPQAQEPARNSFTRWTSSTRDVQPPRKPS